MSVNVSRRALLGLGAGAVTVGALGVGAASGAVPLPGALGRWQADSRADAAIPTAGPGDERVRKRRSPARGRDVSFYTAVPAGHGDGQGLPVCLVLHGASATAADFPGFGFGRFLSDAVARGAAPFVLAGATGDRLSWQPDGADDPQRMVHEDVVAWCDERGFDTTRLAAWGWSMGGYGALLLAETFPGFVRAVAAFSPNVHAKDRVLTGIERIGGTPVGLWCGEQDPLLPEVRNLAARLPRAPEVASYTPGAHTRAYWNTVTPAAFDFISAQLHPLP